MESRERVRPRRPLGRSKRRARSAALAGAGFLVLALAARSALAQTTDEPIKLLSIGSFSGAPAETAGEYFDNELFREARTGDLFQELGDLEISVGKSWPGTSVDASITYSRRVIDRHRELAAGTTVGDADLSWFQTLNSARAKTETDVDYLSDPPGPFGVGLHAESGFVLTAAETQPPRALGRKFSRQVSEEHLRDELRGYWNSRDARFRRHILPRVGRTVVAMVDALASSINEEFEDTEKGALYFEGFVEPLTLWVDLGFPLKVDLFTSADERLAPGDGVTYTAFLDFSPLRIGAKAGSFSTSYEAFYRLIRETTVIEEANDHVLVRVRTIAARGRELTPIKVRPELRFLFLRYGYTFVQDRRDRGRFRVADISYRFDLARPEGRAALEALLGSTNRVRTLAPIAAAEQGQGVEVLAAAVRGGDRRDSSQLARFPSWFRFRHQSLALVQDVSFGDATVREATQGRRQSASAHTFGTRRNRSSTEVMTVQANPEADRIRATPRALEVRTTVRDRDAGRNRKQAIAGLWREIPGAPAMPPELLGEREIGLVAAFTTGARGDALNRLFAFPTQDIWRVLGEAALGPGQGDAWSTALARASWRSEAKWDGKRLLARADRFVRRFDELRDRLAHGEIEGPGWAQDAFSTDEFPFLQQLILKAGAGASDGVSYTAELWTDQMPRPMRLFAGRSPIARLGTATAEPVASPVGAEAQTATPASGLQARLDASENEAQALARDIDSLQSSAPRLLAGKMFLERTPSRTLDRFLLSLFSDVRFDPSQRLRIELRQSRIRADLPYAVEILPLGEPQAVPEGPFMISKLRYDVTLPESLAVLIKERLTYSLYLRVLNPEGLPLSEEEPLHFRIPRHAWRSAKR